jgi:hypothetical protein
MERGSVSHEIVSHGKHGKHGKKAKSGFKGVCTLPYWRLTFSAPAHLHSLAFSTAAFPDKAPHLLTFSTAFRTLCIAIPHVQCLHSHAQHPHSSGSAPFSRSAPAPSRAQRLHTSTSSTLYFFRVFRAFRERHPSVSNIDEQT